MANQSKCYKKSLNKGLFVIAVFLMSFTVGMAANMNQAGPGDGPHKPEPVDLCRYEMTGCVTYAASRIIVLDGVTIFKTPLDWTPPQVGDEIWIKYWVNPDGEKVGCSRAIIGTCL